MYMETTKNKGFTNWIRTSITARMLMVGVIILVLLIPLVFIKDLIIERSFRQEDVVEEEHQCLVEVVIVVSGETFLGTEVCKGFPLPPVVC